MNTTTLIIIGLLALSIIANIAFIVWMSKTEKRLKRFFQGKKATDLEESFHVLDTRIGSLEQAKQSHDATLANHDARIKQGVKSIPLTRFNPFPDVGGNQSFAMSLVDEQGNGVVLSSLYARDRMSVFAKGVKAGKGEQELSEEEQQILTNSLQ